MTQAPRGIRNNNPGNIRVGAKWQGLGTPAGVDIDADFCQFKDASWGIRALAVLLIAYQDKHDIHNIAGIVARWAPPSENDDEAYIQALCGSSGFTRDQPLNLHTYEHMQPVLEAIVRHENGNGPFSTISTWYDAPTISAGLSRAGVVKAAPVVAAVPVTRETVAATGTAGLGLAQLAQVAPDVQTAMSSASDHISSGSTVRVIFGVCTILVAGYIAWSQINKHQNGVVQ